MAGIQNIAWFKKIGKDDLVLVGKKAFGLDTLSVAGFDIPPGFIITTDAYKEFLSGVYPKISESLEEINIDDPKNVKKVATSIQRLILATELGENLTNDILKSYESMNEDITFNKVLRAFDFLKSGDQCHVAIRACGVGDDQGHIENQEFITFLNVKGVEQLKRGVKACFASVFSTDNIVYREKEGIPNDEVGVAIIVQKMVKAEKSGILYTSNPKGRFNEAIFEGVWGLGKTIAEVENDYYILDKNHNQILKVDIKPQSWAYYGGGKGKVVRQELPERKVRFQKIYPPELIRLVLLARNVEEKLEQPFKIEIAFEREKPWIVNVEKMDIDNWSLEEQKVIQMEEYEKERVKEMIESPPAQMAEEEGFVTAASMTAEAMPESEAPTQEMPETEQTTTQEIELKTTERIKEEAEEKELPTAAEVIEEVGEVGAEEKEELPTAGEIIEEVEKEEEQADAQVIEEGPEEELEEVVAEAEEEVEEILEEPEEEVTAEVETEEEETASAEVETEDEQKVEEEVEAETEPQIEEEEKEEILEELDTQRVEKEETAEKPEEEMRSDEVETPVEQEVTEEVETEGEQRDEQAEETESEEVAEEEQQVEQPEPQTAPTFDDQLTVLCEKYCNLNPQMRHAFESFKDEIAELYKEMHG